MHGDPDMNKVASVFVKARYPYPGWILQVNMRVSQYDHDLVETEPEEALIYGLVNFKES
jgi:hypothetical protein